ncbi:YybH family protein [Paraburkholderia acidisoli]|uniref:SgcJ/EcaC family oxidoreductase n=1 Tax=Paraburkholderia acidisoli TaxID=2571748 RepID=A0A7Z2JHP5_9BURK|nr:SgcJ/EcaC family oxidoreductase [Paraburkholderia acidisoli]QGZ65992.1 SgcJ/EcaC family oxidoreductase [Paraburkholderia acidisoli]
MTDDERAIRELIDTWMAASRAGDTDTILSLMTDDVVFSVPGMEPFGKAAFEAASRAQQGMRVDGTAQIVELQVLGEWAFVRNRIEIAVTPPGAAQPVQRAGYTLTLLRKAASGRWLLARDANLVDVKK